MCGLMKSNFYRNWALFEGAAALFTLGFICPYFAAQGEKGWTIYTAIGGVIMLIVAIIDYKNHHEINNRGQ